MKQNNRNLVLSSFIVLLTHTDAFAHQVPGDLLRVHHGVTHPGIGITHVFFVAFIALNAWLLSRTLVSAK